ncbi:polysaccharide deacetylase family protein [Leptospira kanakyensis]|uniref:polysaccharide deacetylase family protein n=1 Tax=Leptospira kanakyensis TaxID=2484968 RepID=UPI00223DE1C9|nr:polysaccharide deacetylase family protein [Leptospira kanakyensis]MCW7482116.1 polysaccharide deacetylase family protein [Leptospira kanakyensis]
MAFLHDVLAYSSPFIRHLNSFKKNIKFKPSSDLRVLLYHDIPVEFESIFRDQLVSLVREWKFLDLESFEEIIKGHKEVIGKNLFLTFDDGFSSNRRVAEKILDPLGIKALFFIVSDFVSVNPGSDARNFVSNNILPHLKPNEISDSLSAMNWNDLEYLLDNGHAIGCHTKTHARLSAITDFLRLQDEILKSKQDMESRLGILIKHFAYTFGDIDSFNQVALNYAMKHYEFIYTGLRGNNINVPSWAIRRDAISALDSFNLISAFLEGGADLLYRKKLKIYESWRMR